MIQTMKIAKTFLAGVMLSTSISIPAFAQDQANSLPALQVENSLLELVESTTDNSITFKDGSTLIQYDSYYIATDLNGKDELKITKVDETKVKYENLQTGEVKYATNEIKPIHEDLSFSPQALADGYVYKGKVENSTEIIYATASAIAGILASFIGGPVGGRIAGILVSIGGYYLSKDAPRAYWVTKTYTRDVKHSDFNATLFIRKDHHYYKYHDYTGLIDTASTIQTCQPFGCGPVNEY
ncbi:adenosine deaminase [Paenibacillus sp. DR312]|uniref:adenosine deaminase n=2 Tax=unclassified Paenibacillus TaxID=185978 RepID=UPI001C95AFA4|nr:adenosine deaminase [Paenibacillus sp. DR312]QZN74770.1 adenosine deaminase [Paenibacillus sp. DR312]